MPPGNSGINPGLEASDPARALQDAVRRGESFSGRERHTVFQNRAGADFADVSGISGLDLPDDGRAACFTDWDGDGDLDLWIANRSGPQVRFFENRHPSGGAGITVRLVGTKSNRDAVGARAVLSNGGERQTRFVSAGGGFLAQGSKTLHFGVGAAPGEARFELTVHWPGGAAETFGDLAPGGCYRITEGEAAAAPCEPAGPGAAGAAGPAIAKPPDRTLFAARLPVAPIFPRPAGSEGGPYLLALTAEGCGVCEAQLAEWAEEPPPVPVSAHRLDFLGATDPGRLRAMQLAAERHFDVRDRPQPTPLTFLVDGGDHLRALYRGRIDPAVLAADIAALKNPDHPGELPFAGVWSRPVRPGARPLSYAEDLLDAGLLELAGRYIEANRPELEGDALFAQLLGRLDLLRRGTEIPR